MLKDQIKHVAMVYKIALSVCIGFALAMAAFPAPKTSDNCGVYKVNSRPVTAFVLKPPPSPPAEPATCPVAPKCEPQVTNSEDSVSKTEASNVDERQSRRHHRRRYRVKAYWK